MNGRSAHRSWGFWLADHGLAMGGLVLLAVGAATSWWAMPLGWAALAIAFFARVAEADNLLALPRLGRVAIRTGGLEPPLSFSVRRGARVVAPWPCPGRRPAIREPRSEHLRHSRIARALAVRGRRVSAARS
jgi:hypothetical protein